jgi:hypothetical protein
LAKPAAPQKDNQPKPLIPVTTDARSELYFLLGRLQGAGIESADRITVLVTELTAPAPAEGENN